MSYAIIRNANYKKDNLAGLYKHNERKNTNYSNKDIIKDKSINNYSIKKCNTTYSNALKKLQEENNLQGRIIKTTNVVCEFIITSDKEFFDSIGQEETKRYFQTAFDFVSQYKNLGEKYILSAKVHLDETTPHMHLVFVPVVHTLDKQSGKQIDKIACSEYWKGKDSYRQLQDSFYSYITNAGFNLERGQTNNIEHLSTDKLKQITNFENIKYELNNNDIKELETKDVEKICKQNKELIEKNKKLKLNLSKAYIAIKQLSQLKQENISLTHENQKLRQENKSLRNYISKTFEVVKHLFDFPIDKLKMVISNFLKSYEK